MGLNTKLIAILVIAFGHLSVMVLRFHSSVGALISVMIIPDGLIIGIQTMSFRRCPQT